MKMIYLKTSLRKLPDSCTKCGYYIPSKCKSCSDPCHTFGNRKTCLDGYARCTAIAYYQHGKIIDEKGVSTKRATFCPLVFGVFETPCALTKTYSK